MNSLSIDNKTSYVFEFENDFLNILNSFSKILNYNQKQSLAVDVLITDNKGIKKLSKLYRNINKETDVLSFPFDFQFENIYGFLHLGEIVLSYEKIISQANEFNHSLRREFCFLFAHGLVHLSGRDHKQDTEEKEFNNLVYAIMDEVGIKKS